MPAPPRDIAPACTHFCDPETASNLDLHLLLAGWEELRISEQWGRLGPESRCYYSTVTQVINEHSVGSVT